MHEIGHGGAAAERKINPKELARTPARKRQRGFAQCLARDRAGVDTGASDVAEFLHQRDAPAKNRRGICSADSGRSAADDHEVVGVGLHSLV